MSNGQFEQLFQTCVSEVGAAYIGARDAVIAMGASVIPQLEQRVSASDWRDSTAAAILLGWLRERELFEQALVIARTTWAEQAGPKPIAGDLSPTRRAAALASLGPAIVPRLIEIVTKTDEGDDGNESQAILLALDYLRDERAVMPLADLAGRAEDEGLQLYALAVLGSLGDERAFDVAQAILANRGKGPILRGGAAVVLGQLGDRRATAAVLAAAQDQTERQVMRESAVRALGYMRDPAASAGLAALLDDAPDERLGLMIIQALGNIGDQTALAALDSAGRMHPDPTLRSAAEEAQRNLLA